MSSEKENKFERMSVSLNKEAIELIEKLRDKYGSSKSEVIRKALKYLDVINEKGEVSLHALWVYLDALAKGEHIILDTASWDSFFSDVEEHSEKFWERTYEIGRQHWKEYRDKGIDDVDQVLNYINHAGWYRLSKNNEDSYTLILKVKESRRFVKSFLKGVFDSSPYDVQLEEGYGKLRVKVKS